MEPYSKAVRSSHIATRVCLLEYRIVPASHERANVSWRNGSGFNTLYRLQLPTHPDRPQPREGHIPRKTTTPWSFQTLPLSRKIVLPCSFCFFYSPFLLILSLRLKNRRSRDIPRSADIFFIIFSIVNLWRRKFYTREKLRMSCANRSLLIDHTWNRDGYMYNVYLGDHESIMIRFDRGSPPSLGRESFYSVKNPSSGVRRQSDMNDTYKGVGILDCRARATLPMHTGYMLHIFPLLLLLGCNKAICKLVPRCASPWITYHNMYV